MNQNLTLSPLGLCFAQAAYDVQSQVVQALPDPGLYFPMTYEEIEAIIANGHLMGAFDGNQLVAFASVYYPGTEGVNVGHELGFDHDQLMQVAYFKAVNVLPNYRGHKLQKRLYKRLFRQVELDIERSPSKGLASPNLWLTTVSPDNLPSLYSSIDLGFSVCARFKLYGGHWRYVMKRPQP